MDTLPMRTTTLYVVDYDDLERFVAAHYPEASRYRFRDEQACPNDAHHRFVVKANPLSEDDQQTVDRFVQEIPQQYGPSEELLLTDLCNRGLIPEGTYLIEVCW